MFLLIISSFFFFFAFSLGLFVCVCMLANTLVFFQWSTVPAYIQIYSIWCPLYMLDTISLFSFLPLEPVTSNSVLFFTDC